jgi:hypothetical protein
MNNTREECHWSHAWQRFKQSKGVKLIGILECKFIVRERELYSSRNPMILTLPRQNPWCNRAPYWFSASVSTLICDRIGVPLGVGGEGDGGDGDGDGGDGDGDGDGGVLVGVAAAQSIESISTKCVPISAFSPCSVVWQSSWSVKLLFQMRADQCLQCLNRIYSVNR